MIIAVDCPAEDLGRAPRADLEIAVSEIIRAHRSGDHLAVVSRSNAEWLRTNLDLTARDKSSLARLGLSYTQNAQLLRVAHTFLRLSPLASGLRRFGNVIEIGPAEFRYGYILNRSVLIVEDTASDGELFLRLFQWLLDRCELPNFKVEIVHGGGDRIATVLQRLVRDRRIAFTIVDTDLDAPIEGVLPKLTRLNKIPSQANWPLCRVGHLPCREIENLIPLALIASAPCAHGREDTIRCLQLISDNEVRSATREHAYWHYFDVKKGINHDRLQNIQAPERREWISKKLARADIDVSSFNLDGFGEAVIDTILRSNRLSAELRNQVRTTDWHELFGKHVVEVMWTFAASRQERT